VRPRWRSVTALDQFTPPRCFEPQVSLRTGSSRPSSPLTQALFEQVPPAGNPGRSGELGGMNWREPTGLRNSDGTPGTRIATNVAWTHFAGSLGFEWGYTGSGPTELAFPRFSGHGV
jgi:hypothetical protein